MLDCTIYDKDNHWYDGWYSDMNRVISFQTFHDPLLIASMKHLTTFVNAYIISSGVGYTASRKFRICVGDSALSNKHAQHHMEHRWFPHNKNEEVQNSYLSYFVNLDPHHVRCRRNNISRLNLFSNSFVSALMKYTLIIIWIKIQQLVQWIQFDCNSRIPLVIVKIWQIILGVVAWFCLVVAWNTCPSSRSSVCSDTSIHATILRHISSDLL